GHSQPSDEFYLILLKRHSGRLAIGNPGGQNEPAGNTAVTDGKWHHVGLVHDGNLSVRLYVDGKLDVECKRWYATNLTGEGSLGENFVGILDEFLIVDRALSGQEIHSFFVQGNPSAANSKEKQTAAKEPAATERIDLNGKLFRLPGRPEVYLVEGGKLRHV